VGGDPDSFADFWRIKGTNLVMQRMRGRRVARPRQYMGGKVYGSCRPRTCLDDDPRSRW